LVLNEVKPNVYREANFFWLFILNGQNSSCFGDHISRLLGFAALSANLQHIPSRLFPTRVTINGPIWPYPACGDMAMDGGSRMLG
jgi:hypothetical protein